MMTDHVRHNLPIRWAVRRMKISGDYVIDASCIIGISNVSVQYVVTQGEMNASQGDIVPFLLRDMTWQFIRCAAADE